MAGTPRITICSDSATVPVLSLPSFAVHMQELVHTAQQPHPGLTAGLVVNSTVFTLGLNILLKGGQDMLLARLQCIPTLFPCV